MSHPADNGDAAIDPLLADRNRVAVDELRETDLAGFVQAALQLLWVALLVLAVWLGWSRYAAVARDAYSASTANDASPAPTPAPHPGSP